MKRIFLILTLAAAALPMTFAQAASQTAPPAATKSAKAKKHARKKAAKAKPAVKKSANATTPDATNK